MAIIYKITNKINGKVYIGETVRNLNARWTQHLNKAKGGSKEHLYASMRFYGIENFIIEEIDRCSNDIRFEVESSYIIKFNSLEPEGYNWLLYQNGVNKYCEEVILEDWAGGLSIVAISEKRHMGIKTVSSILKENGISQGEILKRRNKTIGEKSSKIVNQYNLDGELLATFPSASAAARELNFNVASIGKSCNGDLKTAYGYIWQYEDSDNIEEIIASIQDSKKVGKRNKAIIQKALDGTVIDKFESASEAGRKFNASHANIARAAREGKTAYGFYWEYI